MGWVVRSTVVRSGTTGNDVRVTGNSDVLLGMPGLWRGHQRGQSPAVLTGIKILALKECKPLPLGSVIH